MNVIEKVVKTYQILKNTEYKSKVEEAVDLCFVGKLTEAEQILNSLPKNTEEVLLAQLVEKLKGKSVETNLKRLLSGKIDTVEESLVVVSSLKTHCLLEIKNNPEYILLLEKIESKYNELRQKLMEA